MTLQEFSNEFDVLYNNITSNQAPGLNEYEKSVFLTKAQYQIVKHYANPRSNKVQQGLDESPKRQIDFSTLYKTALGAKNTNPIRLAFDVRSQAFMIPEDTFIIVNEQCQGKKIYTVLPITSEQYDTLMQKPYPYPPKNVVWRLITEQLDFAPLVELIGGEEGMYYKIRYIKRPQPIILEDLEEDYSIDGCSEKSECELPEEIHNEVLQRAVELASLAYKGDLQAQLAAGLASQTDIGVLSQGE
jgi:hypothetical protein